MIRFLNKPNLPEGRVKSIICGEIPTQLKEFLLKRDIEIFYCGENKAVHSFVSHHADMAALYLGGNKIIVDKNRTALKESLEKFGMNITESYKAISGDYPEDVILNFAIINNTLIGKLSALDDTVKIEAVNLSFIDVKQGYAKCSVLPVSEKAFITDDVSIYNKCLPHGFDILLIQKGDILLKGQNYGFIGGAASKISKDEVLFFGNLSYHQNKKEILEFLNKHNCKALDIKSMPLCDLGGIIQLTEEV